MNIGVSVSAEFVNTIPFPFWVAAKEKGGQG